MTKKILTVRKAAWANKFQPNLIKGTPLNPNAGVEQRYYSNLLALIRRMTAETEKEIRKLFDTEHAQEYFAEDASIAAQARILTNALIRKFDALFATNAPGMADAFADQSNAASSKALHSSIQQLSGGLSLKTTTLQGGLKDILSATVTENVALIKSIPEKYLNGVQQAVMRSITTGNGLQDLVPYLSKNKGITERRARMIANDQTRKAFNNLNKGRMQALGIEEYEWLHTGGSNEPRRLHIEMSGNIYKFAEPPIIDTDTGERGIPGQLINCRCRMVPVINFKGAQ